ncbi:MAG: RIP metalloprotease RseP [Vallitaleaceae bacterium]|nr:RIP metalloprotease RseP [Vallitaleaceae bacterium]
MSILVAILIFGLIVLIHEGGHFFFARINGIVVEEFAIGMGPKIIGKEYKGTLFSFRILPFGGFCKVLGEDSAIEQEGSYSSKSVWAKMIMVFGGPLFNFILALIFAFVLISLSGIITTKVSDVVPDSPAQLAGLQTGDTIVKINNKNIIAYKEILIYLNERKGGLVDLTYKRDGVKKSIQIQPNLDKESGSYKIGFYPETIADPNLIQTIEFSFREMALWVKLVPYGLSMLFNGSFSANEVSGPVGIVSAVSENYKESAQYGFTSAVATISFWVVLLSANLGVMNLLPIPALDGGRLVFLIIEAIRRKPMDQAKEGIIHFVGYVFLMLLMVLILFNDFKNIFTKG